jgi:hypothetical protein
VRDLLEQYDCYSRILPDSALTAWGCTYTEEGVITGCPYGTTLRHPLPVRLIFGTASFFVRVDMFDVEAVSTFTIRREQIKHERMVIRNGALVQDVEATNAAVIAYAEEDAALAAAPSTTSSSPSALRIPVPSNSGFEDDWYFSGSLALSGVSRFVIPMSRRQLVQFDTLWPTWGLTTSRGDLSNTENSSDKNFHAMLAWYFSLVRPEHRAERPVESVAAAAASATMPSYSSTSSRASSIEAQRTLDMCYEHVPQKAEYCW